MFGSGSVLKHKEFSTARRTQFETAPRLPIFPATTRRLWGQLSKESFGVSWSG